MRVSIVKGDPGYRYNFDNTRCIIYLDGKKFTHAVTADEELGMVLAYVLDAEGRPVADYDARSYKMHELFGHVTIDITDECGKSIKLPKVEFEQNPMTNDISVKVFSRMKPNQIRRLTIDWKNIADMTKEQKAQSLGLLAGAGAEYCCEKYGDIYDPAEVSRYAIEEAICFFTAN